MKKTAIIEPMIPEWKGERRERERERERERKRERERERGIVDCGNERLLTQT